MLNNIKIVLVETSHPGNIGAVARAMKNMCMGRLCLVKPKKFPHAEATARAAGADSILEAAECCSTLGEALQGSHLVIGASARLRKLPWPTISPRVCADTVFKEAPESEIACVFGREDSGLTNEELQFCHYLVHIPGNPDYNSLNVAAAVQIIAYELFLGAMESKRSDGRHANLYDERDGVPVTAGAMGFFYDHLRKVLVDIEFLKPENPRKLMLRLRRLFNRARPNEVELNILRGILTAVERRARQCKTDQDSG